MSLEMTITNNNLPLLSQLEPLMRAKIFLALKQVAMIMERGAKLAIQEQIAPDGQTWEALSAWYVEWKTRQGFSSQIYLMSSSYFQAITWDATGGKEGEDLVAIVGVKRDAGTIGNSSEDIYRIAEILEYGWEQYNVRIPPRPLWRPLLQVNRRQAQTRVGIAIAQATKIIAGMAKGTSGAP